MATPKPSSDKTIHQLKITLRGSKPPIWRRVQVPSDISLARLHDVLQIVMGWEDYHLHRFTISGVEYGERDPDGDIFGFGQSVRSENTKLSKVAPSEKAKFVYEYDFGDGWEHQIVVEKILPPESGKRYPACLTGKLACPPEDCGGIWGYYDLLSIIQNPDDPEYEERLEWLGEGFDPEAVDLNAINTALGAKR